MIIVGCFLGIMPIVEANSYQIRLDSIRFESDRIGSDRIGSDRIGSHKQHCLAVELSRTDGVGYTTLFFCLLDF
jgi:hypothetical protein